MSFKVFTDSEKLAAVQRMIIDGRKGIGVEILKAIAKDIQARAPFARDETVLYLERRLTAVTKSKTALGYEQGPLRELAHEVMNKWPVIRDAMIDRNIKTSPPEPSRTEQ